MVQLHPAGWGSSDWHQLTINLSFHWWPLGFILLLFFCLSSPFPVVLAIAVAVNDVVFVMLAAVIFLTLLPLSLLSFLLSSSFSLSLSPQFLSYLSI